MKYLACDFETTTYDGIEKTEVWLAGYMELFTDHSVICHSIDEFFKELFKINQNVMCYFHNLKFDGAFILDYLLNTLKWEQAYTGTIEDGDARFVSNKFMFNKTFKYIISDMGRWYSITIKYKGNYYEIRDSLKLLPFSLSEIGNAFKTKHKKLTMEYKGFRYAGCEVSEEEMEYFKGDLFVLKEALEILKKDGHLKMTIGACCMSEFKKIIGKYDWDVFFPDLRKYESPFGETVESFIRQAYKGGWCYVKKGKENKIINGGITLDVNSLYPSVMEDENNYYPIGAPNCWEGDYIPEEVLLKERYCFVRIKCAFDLKENYLPFIQIKHSYFYKGNENLTTSKIFIDETEEYVNECYIDGEYYDDTVELTLTITDYYLFLEHYNVRKFQILGGVWFYAKNNLFKEYIRKYKKIKEESVGAVRTEAKLFLNNLYGKLASSDNSSFKIALGREEMVKFFSIPANDKDVVYIPAAAAVTSYARNKTIRSAQKNFKYFCYSDTDSLHLSCHKEEVIGVEMHPTKFGAWDVENEWDVGFFIRQKTYIERSGNDYVFKCAGMPTKCKKLFLRSVDNDCTLEGESVLVEPHTTEEEEFLEKNRDITDFKAGIIVPGKLRSKRIPGGVVLVDTTFELK